MHERVRYKYLNLNHINENPKPRQIKENPKKLNPKAKP